MPGNISGGRMTIAVIPPLMSAVREKFAFPDRDLMFDPVDDMTVSLIRLSTMGGSRNNYYGRFTDGNPSCPVLGNGQLQMPFLPGLRQYLMDHRSSQRSVSLIFKI